MRSGLSRTALMLISVVLLMASAEVPSAAKALPQDSQTQQDQSIADAARRSREQKKYAKRQARVISNEDLDMEYFKPGQEGLYLGAPARLNTEAPRASAVASEATDQSSGSANIEAQAKDDKASQEAAAEGAQIAKLKEQIAEAENQLKWQRRELALDQDSVYSNPNYTDYKTGKAKLDSEQQRINDKQQETEGLKAQLAALQ